MADEREHSSSRGGGPDAAALSVALGGGGASDEAREFLRRQSAIADKQGKLLDLQIEDLTREDVVRHWSLRVRHISDVMKLAFEVSLAFIVVALALGLAATVWSAAHDDGLVIEAFSVPPDMAARGLTGQAVAAQFQDKLAAMQAATDSARPAASYTSNWGNDIKVVIPDTGISINEFYRYLASSLGNETHIRGEVYRTPSGIVIAARAGGEGGTKISGVETDFDKLLQQSAEAIYRQTQPYRYAVFLEKETNSEAAGATAVFRELIERGSPTDRMWAHVGLGSIYDNSDPERGPDEQRKAAALASDFALPYSNLSNEDGIFGHDEQALVDSKIALRLFEQGDHEISERANRISLPNMRANVDFIEGDFLTALHGYQEVSVLPDYSGLAENARSTIPVVLALLHQNTATRTALGDIPENAPAPGNFFNPAIDVVAYYWMGDWAAAVRAGKSTEAIAASPGALDGLSQKFTKLFLAGSVWPYVARAQAEMGNLKGAHALVDRTLRYCYACDRNRGDIDAIEGNWGGADFWFAKAVNEAPSIPIAYTDWGRVLLARGKFDAAIAKFAQANAKGPHFADPLEMWGEALMLKNRSDLALAKFAEAEKYAPNWGRLHLKWGEALWWSGKKDEARKAFAAAAGMDLLGSERTAVAAWEKR